MGARATPEQVRRRESVRQLQSRWHRTGWTGRAGGRRWRAIRRLLAVALIAAAGWSASVDRSSGVQVVALTRDLPTGATLTTGDVESARLEHPPDGVLTSTDQAVGRKLGAAARRGEVLTDLRLVDTGGPDPGPGRVAIAVRPADPALVELLQPGMTVTVVGVGEDGAAAMLCSDALVLAVLDETADRSGKSRPVLLGVPTADADRVTGGSLSADIALQFT